MSAFFNYIHPRDRSWWNRKRDGSESRDEWRQAGSRHQREGINRPDRGMIVIIATHKLRSFKFFPRRSNSIEVRMDDGSMIVVASAGVNVLKRRYKECQQQRKASL